MSSVPIAAGEGSNVISFCFVTVDYLSVIFRLPVVSLCIRQMRECILSLMASSRSAGSIQPSDLCPHLPFFDRPRCPPFFASLPSASLFASLRPTSLTPQARSTTTKSLANSSKPKATPSPQPRTLNSSSSSTSNTAKTFSSTFAANFQCSSTIVSMR